MITIRSFLVLGLSLVLGLTLFGFQIGRAVRTGRELPILIYEIDGLA